MCVSNFMVHILTMTRRECNAVDYVTLVWLDHVCSVHKRKRQVKIGSLTILWCWLSWFFIACLTLFCFGLKCFGYKSKRATLFKRILISSLAQSMQHITHINKTLGTACACQVYTLDCEAFCIHSFMPIACTFFPLFPQFFYESFQQSTRNALGLSTWINRFTERKRKKIVECYCRNFLSRNQCALKYGMSAIRVSKWKWTLKLQISMVVKFCVLGSYDHIDT